ncbi:MAG: FAD-dependent oxidoreductase [Gammaproteobacteria bacterium]|nr:FAD-dependent oxidoreductase [Gammaproteobacteria bacterium]
MLSFNESAPNHVCIVGAGPAGVVLSILLARRGIPVTLLEAQADFDRDFRGDTLHASAMEILDQMGLAEPVLKLCHARVDKFQLTSTEEKITMADFSCLDTLFPYVALIPQERFLTFMTEEAKKLPDFRLVMNAKVHDLIVENNKICGVTYMKDGKDHVVRASLTIGADGRGSRVREKAGIKLGKTTPPIDVIWFKLPRHQDNKTGNSTGGRFGTGVMLVMLDRGYEWQLGFVILKGSYKTLREAGMAAFHDELIKLAPELKSSISDLKDWSQCAILSVVTGRVNQWYKPGLLLIGDAAHVMSPVGGVGINYAIHDAVAAANALIEPLHKGNVTELDLADVQFRRERPIRFIQAVQSIIQRRIIANALKSDKPFRPPLLVRFMARFPFFQKKMARILAYGIQPETLQHR